MRGPRTGLGVTALRKIVSQNCGLSESCPESDRRLVRQYVEAARDLLGMLESKAAAIPARPGKDGEPSAPRALREPKTALEEQAQALVGAVKFYRRMCRDHGLTSKEATKSAGWMEHVANATDSQIAEARSAPKPSSAEGSPSSLPASSPGETALDLEAVEKRYTSEPVPPCRVCGGKLSIQSIGGGSATVWGCSPFEDDPENPDKLVKKADRGLADSHYSESRWTQYRGGDPDVLTLIAEVRRLRSTPGAQESRPQTEGGAA